MSDDVRIWQGERPVAAVAPDDRGLTYGDGLFETLRVVAGRPVLADGHWQRLSRGCALLDIPMAPFWRQALDEFLRGRADGVVRLQVTRGPGGRGYLPPVQVEPTFILSWHPAPVWPAAHAEQGIRLGDCDIRLAAQPVLAGIKHGNRLEQVLARRELARQPDCAEALLREADGHLVEGVFSNLFLVRDGLLLTPDLSRCGIRGVLRDALLAAASEAGLPVAVRVLGEADLCAADEIFMANSVFGIWPVLAWREQAWHPGRITRQCQALIAPWFAPE